MNYLVPLRARDTVWDKQTDLPKSLKSEILWEIKTLKTPTYSWNLKAYVHGICSEKTIIAGPNLPFLADF